MFYRVEETGLYLFESTVSKLARDRDEGEMAEQLSLLGSCNHDLTGAKIGPVNS